ncbi:hypothetical protein [Streptacidiphilus sp. P02-A3a]|uniref:deoxynucleotide monophosphate kinase family protein n=1 Tax=Streptacidiphilus sp. P02-A3a TaxID=2704468 RepID=UPI0015FCAC89|nr:hypothetical protein [Streptacidiphilus sp. P02-A3a]
MPHHIALMGRARSGKDSVAARLQSAHGYTPVAFAAPLKDAALRLDPIVSVESAGCAYLDVRLSDVVRRWGWDGAKERVPEVRRTLQRFGQGVRDLTPDYWLRRALDLVAEADRWNMPVVITDCRYLNEATALRDRGFILVRVERPFSPRKLTGVQHQSETELDDYPADRVIRNTGTLADLAAQADALACPDCPHCAAGMGGLSCLPGTYSP